MKKVLSLLLSLLLVASMSFGINFSATAEEQGDIVLGKTYTEAFDLTDDYSKANKAYFDYFFFKLPAKGKVTLTIKSKKKEYKNTSSRYYIFEDKEDSDKFWTPDNTKFNGKWSVTLKKGSYMFVPQYYPKKKGKDFGATYTFKLSYKPDILNTSLVKVTAKKGAFTAKWKKAKNVSGYQIQYSLKKNFKNAKILDIKGAKKTSATVSELLGKKKYYVRIRTFRTLTLDEEEKTYYGKWSKKKTVKTKTAPKKAAAAEEEQPQEEIPSEPSEETTPEVPLTDEEIKTEE